MLPNRTRKTFQPEEENVVPEWPPWNTAINTDVGHWHHIPTAVGVEVIVHLNSSPSFCGEVLLEAEERKGAEE